MNGFISCDWGTSSLRLRLVEGGLVLAEMENDQGIGLVYREWQAAGLDEHCRVQFYHSRLLPGLQWLARQTGRSLEGVPVVISGMASADIGLCPLGWAPTPLNLLQPQLPLQWIEASAEFPHACLVAGGLRSANEVMRGEETQLIGSAAYFRAERVYAILPGTHSKQVEVEKGEVRKFQTAMTGEIFGLLTRFSLLQNSVAAGTNPGDESSRASFLSGVDASADRNWLNRLFGVRTRQLIEGYSPQENYHFLSGLLIGYELRELPAEALPLVLIGDPAQCGRYALALEHLGRSRPLEVDATAAVIHGQSVLLDQRNPSSC